jgi:hypothetical protein
MPSAQLAMKSAAQLLEYGQEFERLRNEPMTIFEIGIKKEGGSVKLWHDYFPKARIVGLDLEKRVFKDHPRVVARAGDQSDPAVLNSIIAEFAPFGIVIDDGSHVPEHQILGFETLFPHIRDGGLYVCEDIHTSYRHTGRSAVDYFSALIKPLIARKEIDGGDQLPGPWRDVARVTFVMRTVIVAKRIGGPKATQPAD